MRIRAIGPAIAVFVLVAGRPSPGWAQHEGHQLGGSSDAVSGACRDSAQQGTLLIDAMNQRLEQARQTNNMAQLRAAIDDVQTAIGGVRLRLANCLDSLAQPAPPAIASMPGMSHDMPAAPQPPASGSDVTIELKGPASFRAGDQAFEITVTGADGRPISDVEVSVLLVMPAMPEMRMPEMRNEVTLQPADGGRYTGTGQVPMAGQWTATITARRNGRVVGERRLPITAR